MKQEKLRELGWKVIVIWECELKWSFQETMDKVEKELNKISWNGEDSK
jgi:G:T-mismatch repair DNA endonuclease (very short patch repair protein)